MVKDIVWIQEDLLNGAPKDLRLFKPCFIAQRILKDAYRKADDVVRLERDLFRVFDIWKREHGIAPKPRGLLDLKQRTIDESDPWVCAGWGVDDPLDLFVQLKYSKYSLLLDLISAETEKVLLSILIIYVAKQPTTQSSHTLEGLRVSLMVHKCITELSLFLGDRSTLYKEAFQVLYPQLKMQVANETRSEFARLGGEAKNRGVRALRAKALALFNAGNFPNMRTGARAITAKVQAYGEAELGYWLQTDDPEKKVYEWILKANKDGLIKLKTK